jgi:carbonic anhydrase
MSTDADATAPPDRVRDAAVEYRRLLAENGRYVAAFDRSALGPAPLTGLAIVACMDARLDVEETLGLRTGDAHIIRNAGGLVTEDVVRSLIVSQQLLGTREIIIIEHTDCGLYRADEVALRSRLVESMDVPAGEVAMAFGSFDDLEANLREQVEVLRAHRLLRGARVHGLIFDVRTGRLHELA